MDKKKFLKVKIKSLAEEAKIIRLEEHRARAKGDRDTLTSLQWHRKHDVRNEARATLLAYGFLRGRKRLDFERPKDIPWFYGKSVMRRAKDMVAKYGTGQTDTDFDNWYNCHVAD